MKKTIIYMLISASVFTACKKDFTDLSPLSARNVGNFYKTPEDMVIATNAIYKALQMNGTFNQGYWLAGEMRSDNTDHGSESTGLGADFMAIENFQENPATSTPITSIYLDSYVGINRANIVLDRIEAMEMDATLKNRLKGEALFLRSVFYYHIAVFFGKAPIVLNEIAPSEGKNYPQKTTNEILTQIATDLELAATLLPSKHTAADVGRATSAGANALLGKVYLTLGNKTSAATALRRVIADSNYGLLDDYADLWGVANENNKESLFEVQFQSGGTNTGNSFSFAMSALYPQVTGAYKNVPQPELENAYESGDLRKAISMSYYGDDRWTPTGTETRLYSRWVLKYGTDPTGITQGDAPNNFIFLRYADVLLMLAEALGEGTEAYELINTVRNRAGLGDISSSTPGTFEEKLLQERRVELAFENHRWPDLLRFGKATEFLTAQGKTNVRLLFPIPQRELDINSSFTQNPL